MTVFKSRASPWLRARGGKAKDLSSEIWSNLRKNNLWKRMVKFSLATIISVIIVLIPAVAAVFPATAFLAPLTTVFAHAGQRAGLMVEGLLMLLTGSITGTAWGFLGLWLSSFVYDDNVQAAFAIRALFMLVSVFHFGYLRSSSPRLIVYVLFHLTPSVVILVGPYPETSTYLLTTIAYPLLIGAGSVVVCNLAIFPELSCDYLAQTTVGAITETTGVLVRTTAWFLQSNDKHLGLHDGIEIIPSAHAVSDRAGFGKRVDKAYDPDSYRWYQRFLPGFRNPVRVKKKQALLRPAPLETATLASLTESKTSLRAAMQKCKAGQAEANLEVSVGALPPNILKPISTKTMRGLVHNTITLIGSCENKYVLIGDETRSDEDSDGDDVSLDSFTSAAGSSGPSKSREKLSGDAKRSSASLLLDPARQLDRLKPSREVEGGDPEILDAIIERIREPTQELMKAVKQTSRSITRSVSYCYGLKRLPSGARTPVNISLEEMDARIDAFMDAIHKFDQSSVDELVRATSTASGDMDIMPKMETFLVSSFLLGLRQAAVHLLQMLQHARSLVEQRQSKRIGVRLHFPGTFGWRTWLSTGGERDAMVLPKIARKKGRTGHALPTEKSDAKETPTPPMELEKPLTRQPPDEENAVLDRYPTREDIDRAIQEDKEKAAKKKRKLKPSQTGHLTTARHWVANTYESLQKSDDVLYALKLVVAFFLISWPAFVPEWRDWYVKYRGVWAPLQLILIFEVAIGTSLFVFVIRLVGVIFGCLMGFLSVEIGGGNRIVVAVVLLLGIWPSVYLQLGSKYIKTGMVATSSMTAVALTAVNTNTPAYQNFYLRILTFFVGSTAGLLVELMLYPARARDRMVEALSSCIKQMTNMQTAIAVGVDNPSAMDLHSLKVQRQFERSRAKAMAALTAAETFLPFCLTEPRLKGSFRPLHPVYREIIYVLHQIVDRMDNMLQLRRAYGNAVLEELNPEVHAYRRAVAASIALSLFAVNEALTIRMPLPQFLPSARVAKLRLINRVREVLQERAKKQGPSEDDVIYGSAPGLVARDFGRADALADDPSDERTTKIANLHKVLSWNANSAGLMEIIEYLEELVELAKLLVGVNAFRSGLLERPTFKEYATRTRTGDAAVAMGGLGDGGDSDEDSGELRKAVSEALGARKGAQRGDSGPEEHHDTQEVQKQGSRQSGDRDVAVAEADAELRRTSTKSTKSSSRGVRRRATDLAVDGEEFDIPISLQRVSTRRASVRRRRPTIIGRDKASKGKGIQEEDDDP